MLFKLKNFTFQQDYKFDKDSILVFKTIISQINEYVSSFKSIYGSKAHMLEHIVEYEIGLQDSKGDAVYFDDIRKEFEKQTEQTNSNIK